MSLTETQIKYLKVIDKLHTENGLPPTFSQVGAFLSVPFEKRSSVSHFINRMFLMGYVHKGEYLNGSSRPIWLSESGRNAIK
jgi:Mn-dependent DtxR family transcriptional regulator